MERTCGNSQSLSMPCPVYDDYRCCVGCENEECPIKCQNPAECDCGAVWNKIAEEWEDA